MEEFHVIQPSLSLVPYVKQYWFLKTSDVSDVYQRIIPTGNSSIVFHRGANMFSVSNNEMQSKAFITGQITGYYDLVQTGAIDMIAVVFHPHCAMSFFSMPMNELKEKTISVDCINDVALRELQDRLYYASHIPECVKLIESYLLRRLYITKTHNFQRINSVIEMINEGEGDVSKLAYISCLSYKQFKRVFSEYVGTNPKDFIRVIRFQRALYILQSCPEINFTRLSVECGYFDQSHFIKDFKEFSGYTPGEYVALYSPYSDYFF